MIDIRALEKNEENPYLNAGYLDGYKASLKNRGADVKLIDEVLNLNKERKAFINQAETSKAEQNKVSQEIARLKQSKGDASALLKEMQGLSEKIKGMEAAAAEADERVRQALLVLPNLLHHTVPVGTSAEQNRIERTVGSVPKFSFKAKEHWELGEKLGVIDFDRAGKVTGARFAFLKGAGARLERALIQFMMDVHSDKHGYEEMIPPFIVNAKSLEEQINFRNLKKTCSDFGAKSIT